MRKSIRFTSQKRGGGRLLYQVCLHHRYQASINKEMVELLEGKVAQNLAKINQYQEEEVEAKSKISAQEI